MFKGKGGENPSATLKEGWDWMKYQKEDPRGLEKLSQENPEAFNALYKAKYGSDYKA